MSIQVINGSGSGGLHDYSVLYDTVTGFAFGPLFDSEEHAEAFMRWLAPKLGFDHYVPTRNLLAIDIDHWRIYRDEFTEKCLDEDGELREEVADALGD